MNDIWFCEKWKKNNSHVSSYGSIKLRFDKDVNTELKKMVSDYCSWLKAFFTFPVNVMIYIKTSKKIRAKKGGWTLGTFDWYGEFPCCKRPYICIAVGTYYDSSEKEEAAQTILKTISHELTHYFQWINDIVLSPNGLEKQATYWAKIRVSEYYDVGSVKNESPKVLNNLKKTRISKKISQKELADLAHVSRTYIAAIENDNYDLTLNLAVLLCEILGEKVENVFSLKSETIQDKKVK